MKSIEEIAAEMREYVFISMPGTVKAVDKWADELDALAAQEPVACKKCHGEGWYDEGDPDIGSAIFECDRCLGTKVEHTCGEQASCAPCEADDEREAQCDGGSCGTGGYYKACPEKRCQSGVVHCDGACHGLMPDGFAASMPPEREVAVAAAQRIGFWLSAALDDPKVRAELKADINAWFDAAMPFPQPAPPQPVAPEEFQDALSVYGAERYADGAHNCDYNEGTEKARAEVLRLYALASASSQRPTVGREALLYGLNALDSSCKLWHIGEIETVLRALGITITE